MLWVRAVLLNPPEGATSPVLAFSVLHAMWKVDLAIFWYFITVSDSVGFELIAIKILGFPPFLSVSLNLLAHWEG